MMGAPAATLDSPTQPDTTASTHNLALALRSLTLTHFRNYASARMELDTAPVVLTGRNGAGKTNILEAISLLAPGRGIRRARIAEIDNRTEPGEAWAVAATVMGRQGEVKIGTGRDPQSEEGSEKRLVRIDNKPVRAQTELARHMSVIWLTPQMEQLFNEGSSAARKFLDRLAYSFDPEHASRVSEYEYAMRERNKLLQTGGGDASWLDSLEITMAETSAAIAQARLHTAESITHAMSYSRHGFPKAQIAVAGFAEDRLKSGLASVEIEQELQQNLAENRRQDAFAGRALIGAHKSEMHVFHEEKRMPAESCSTGEQKAILLSIVLSQARAGALRHGVVPVLLLDEISAHLDGVRRLELFEEICQIGAQIWVTGTDVSLFAGLQGKAQFFHVENGHLTNT